MLTGCEVTPEQVARAKDITTSSFSNPEQIATLPDGRAVKRAIVVRPNQHDHVVYFIDNATVTNNYEEQNGKVTDNKVRVTLSRNPSPEEIIAAADKLKQQQRAADEAEFARLQKKLGVQ